MRDRLVGLLKVIAPEIKDFDFVVDHLLGNDVVDVVRCKDCARYCEFEGFEYKGRKARYCAWHGALWLENGYCSDGIRRANDEQR